MTFNVSVTGTADENTKRRVLSAFQRFWMDLQRSGAEVTSSSVTGFEDNAGKSFKPFKAQDRIAGRHLRAVPREGRTETGQPGAKSALELSIEAGTTSTSSQPEPAPTGPVTDKTAGVPQPGDADEGADATRPAAKKAATKEGGAASKKSTS